MSEKFIINQNAEVEDTISHITFDSFMEIIIVLNGQSRQLKKLSEENKQLKQLLKCSREEANEYCEELMSIEASIKLYEDINKNLKQAIKESYEILSTDVDVFSEKATEHDINAYIELRELDNKDAYYIAIGTKKAIDLLKRWL